MNPRIKFLNKAIGDGNFFNEIGKVKRQANRMETAEGLDSSVAESQENIFMDTNETIITNGRLVTTSAESETTVAEEDGFTGTVVSGNGVVPFDEAGTFNLAIINDGVTSYGVGQGGEYANGLDFVGVHKATGTSTAERRLRRGFQELQGNDDPSYIFEFLDTNVGSNLITSNPDFETGDATGWTLGAGSSVVATSGIGAPSGFGSYCLKFGASSTDEVTSNKYACTAGNTLKVSFDVFNIASYADVYIRFYNATPTLISTILVKSWTTVINYASPEEISINTVVPVGATQFEIYLLKNTVPNSGFYLDNFSVTVATISNEFGFHGEDGHLLMGNGKFKTNDIGEYITRGSLPSVVYSAVGRTNISTSGSTTVFDLTVPANFFIKGQLRFKVDAYTDATGTPRNLTSTLTVAGTTNQLVLTTGTSLNRLHIISGNIGYASADKQDSFTWFKQVQDGATSVLIEGGQYTEHSGDDASAITVTLTLALSGAVDAGWFNNVIVETVMNTDVW